MPPTMIDVCKVIEISYILKVRIVITRKFKNKAFGFIFLSKILFYGQ